MIAAIYARKSTEQHVADEATSWDCSNPASRREAEWTLTHYLTH